MIASMFSWFGATPEPAVSLVDHAFGWFMVLVFLDALLVGVVMGYYLWKYQRRLGRAWRAAKKWVCITNDVVLLYLIDLQLLFVGTMVLGSSGKALFALWILCGVGVRLTRIHKATARGLFKAAAITQGIMAGVVIVFAAMMGGFDQVAAFTSSATGQWVSLVLIAVTYGIFAKAMTPCWRPAELAKLERDRRKQEKDEEEHQGWLFATWGRWFVNAVNYASHTHEAMMEDTGADIRGALRGTAPKRTDQKTEKKADGGSGLESAKGIFEMAWKPIRFLVIVAAVLVGLSLVFGILVRGCGETMVRLAGSSPAAYARSTTPAAPKAPKARGSKSSRTIVLPANYSGVYDTGVPARKGAQVTPWGTIDFGGRTCSPDGDKNMPVDSTASFPPERGGRYFGELVTVVGGNAYLGANVSVPPQSGTIGVAINDSDHRNNRGSYTVKITTK